MNDLLLSFTNQDDNESVFPSLTLKERLIGFAICSALGVLFHFMAMGSIVGVLLGRTNKFAFMYTIGNVVSIFATFFLIGPVQQLKNMTDVHRRKASMVFVVSIIMTLCALYVLHSKLLTVLFVLVQFAAYVWYILSYVPYGRECLMNVMRRITTSSSSNVV
jgi:hypothetical protein